MGRPLEGGRFQGHILLDGTEREKAGRSMSRWFRMYDEILDDPKVQRLPADLYRMWVNSLALCSRNGGKLPSIADCAFSFRETEESVSSAFHALASEGLFVTVDETFQPKNWKKRQYKSDTSTNRVREYRKRSRNVTETAPEQTQIVEEEKEKTTTVVPNPARAADCFNEVCAAAGWHPRTDVKRQEGLSIIDGWLALGCSLSLILESIKYCSRNGEPTASLRRFDGLIRKKRREQLGGELPITSNDVGAIAQKLGRQMRAA